MNAWVKTMYLTEIQTKGSDSHNLREIAHYQAAQTYIAKSKKVWFPIQLCAK